MKSASFLFIPTFIVASRFCTLNANPSFQDISSSSHVALPQAYFTAPLFPHNISGRQMSIARSKFFLSIKQL